VPLSHLRSDRRTMRAFSIAIPASPFLRQRMAGLSGVARSLILADLAGAETVYVVSTGPVPQDWQQSFKIRERALPRVIFVDRLPETESHDGRLIVLPPDRLLTATGMQRMVEDPLGALQEGVDYFAAGRPGEITWRILLASMKPSEGWFGRHLNRPISFRVSALLMHTDISPNVITWFTFVIALAMAVMLAQGGPLWLALGGLLYQTVSVVDCIDGDIARVTHRTSNSGAALDTMLDMIANLGFAVALTVGLVRTYGPEQLLVSIAMVGVAATCMMFMTVLIRLGPRRGSFDVLRSALAVRLAPTPGLAATVLLLEKMFKRDFYALLAALLCVSGLAWLIPQLALGGVCIWLLAILWCAPVIVADKGGDLLPSHLRM
jgi:phosphatidylglycerophosphate synthase